MLLRLDPDANVTLDLHRLVLGELEDMLRAAATVDNDRAHRIHLGCKRVRSYLRLLRGALGDKRYKKENRFFRDLGRPFGAVRNSEVAEATVEKLLKAHPEALSPEDTEMLRQIAHLPLPEDDTATGLGAVMTAVTEAQARFLVTSRGKVKLKQEVKDLYRQGRRLFKRSQADPIADNLHEWRKHAKYLRFALAALEETGPEDVAWRKLLKKLAKVLGNHHDLSLLESRVSEVGSETILDLIARQEDILAKRALELGERLYGRKPRAFMDGLAAPTEA